MGRDPSQFVPIKYGSDSGDEPFPMMNFMIFSLFLFMLIRLYKQSHANKKGGSGRSSSSRGGGMGGMGGMSDLMNVSKSGATVYGVEKKIRTRFKHVAGL